jgi:hypothetical protein
MFGVKFLFLLNIYNIFWLILSTFISEKLQNYHIPKVHRKPQR